MTLDAGTVDIFQAGPHRYALRSGKIRRIESRPSGSAGRPIAGFTVRRPAKGAPPRLVFPGHGGGRVLLETEEHGRRMELEVDRVIEVNVVPDAVIPSNPAVEKLCGAGFVAGFVGLEKDFILLITLGPLLEMLTLRRHHDEK
ncbi:MAG: hypothetical protein KA419_08105 [Acidobacteria bacterium]|nr:hypothetical protein [Acidobacteriota bacterium]